MAPKSDNKAEEEQEVKPDETPDEKPPREDYSPIEVADLAGVRPQMVYNYLAAGRIPHFVNDSGKKRIKASDANTWIEEYRDNKVKREQRREAQRAAELKGESANVNANA